jgi:CYTH domain-containing protein
MNNTPIETEVKYLIRMPDVNILLAQKGIAVKSIVQTYLLSPDNSTRRVRKIETEDKTTFIFTEKIRISSLSAFEDERELTKEEYDKLLLEADSDRTPIEKTRYAFPFDNHFIEIDVYPFWSDRAILEIELSTEGEKYSMPSFISVIKNVSNDSRYKNARLAKSIVFENID